MYVTIPSDQTGIDSAITFAGPISITQETRLKAGAYLFFEGDTVEWLYRVTSGVLRLTRMLEDGRRQVIVFGYPGDIVGFPAQGLHHTDCDALTDVRLQPYRRSALERPETDPELHRELLDAALREISGMQDHFMMLGRKSAAEKVASFLCVLADHVGLRAGDRRVVDLPMSRADIADFLGLTQETVSRILTQLRKSKIIAIDNITKISILRPMALLALSAGDCD